jgi:hypothetical protein
VVSLKDLSGHEVNCILRSISTDLMHQSLLSDPHCQALESQMARLNDHLCNFGVFANIVGEQSNMPVSEIMRGDPPALAIRIPASAAIAAAPSFRLRRS